MTGQMCSTTVVAKAWRNVDVDGCETTTQISDVLEEAILLIVCALDIMEEM